MNRKARRRWGCWCAPHHPRLPDGLSDISPISPISFHSHHVGMRIHRLQNCRTFYNLVHSHQAAIITGGFQLRKFRSSLSVAKTDDRLAGCFVPRLSTRFSWCGISAPSSKLFLTVPTVSWWRISPPSSNSFLTASTVFADGGFQLADFASSLFHSQHS